MTSLTAFRLPSGHVDFRAIGKIEIIDQLILPHTISYETVESISSAFEAIRSMKIRGAPAIASLASLGIAAELMKLLKGIETDYFTLDSLKTAGTFSTQLNAGVEYLKTSRPTAVNLFTAMNQIINSLVGLEDLSLKGQVDGIIEVCISVYEADSVRNLQIGNNGAEFILKKLEGEGSIQSGEKIAVLTVCNTGSLATSNYGTAFGIITSLQKLNRLEQVYFAQTGPYQQGARLTSLELNAIGVNSTMVCDSAIGALLAEKRVHLFVAGADRIAANGDTANKISTYQISLLCSSPHPFSPNLPRVTVLVAAPITTLDLAMKSGREIEIEERPSWEACTVRGRIVDTEKMAKTDGVVAEGDGGEVVTVLITPPGTKAWNPAFDVTPAYLIEGIVTELGVSTKQEGNLEFDLIAHAARP